MSQIRRESWARGPLAWMTLNRVTPNLLMLFLLIGGLYTCFTIKKEVFPEFDLDMVRIDVTYSGASPEEVEQGIILVLEEAVRGIEGVKELTATAAEGGGTLDIELIAGTDGEKVYQEVRQQVDRINTLPVDSEEPQVSLLARRRQVLSLQIYGAVSEAVLREATEMVRDRLLQEGGITQIDLSGDRDLEIAIEITPENLRRYNLAMTDIAQKIASSSVELPGGSIEAQGGDILLRVSDRRDWANEIARIPLLTSTTGSPLLLGDIATVRETFADSRRSATFNGKPSIGIDVFRVGDQTPIGVSDAVREAMQSIEADLPEGIDWSINSDRSDIFRQRLELLLKNAFMGLTLVLIVLGFFLEFKLAFWVTIGIPTSFLGGLLFMPGFDASINMISMFAFIVALGIVVDDAIVAGENIYEYRQRGDGALKAAITGARDVAVPITFSILTNIVAFMPLYFVPGTIGKVWKVIPVVVTLVFLISWVESLLILPAHLAHTSSAPRSRLTAYLHERQQAFTRIVAHFIQNRYRPFLDWCLHWRFLTIAIGLSILMLVIAYTMSGRMGIILMPRVESDSAVVTAILPIGSPETRAREVAARLVDHAQTVVDRRGGAALSEGIFASVNGNRVEVRVYLTPPDIRPISTTLLTNLWREETGAIPGLQSLRFESDRGGPGSGAGVTVELSHRNIDTLKAAGRSLAERLEEFPNVKDTDDGSAVGKEQLSFRLTPRGEQLGLTTADVARQVRNAFSGAVALRQQRGRNEVTVRVRLPEEMRNREQTIETLLIRTPAGGYVPLSEVASMTRGRAYTSISRRDARRTLTVSANVEPMDATNQVKTAIDATVLPQLLRDFPGLSYSYQGRQASLAESTSALFGGFGTAMIVIYFLLAIPFRSYIQPLIVMLAIPFGVVGAILGHLLMGYSLSLVSMMGIVALSGVVINDSLILVTYANEKLDGGATPHDAILAAGTRRFRPIILTTLTTFGGLAPMIFETSRQAKFMIPMAISLGFGILFATVITLLIVPCIYLSIAEFFQRHPIHPVQDTGILHAQDE